MTSVVAKRPSDAAPSSSETAVAVKRHKPDHQQQQLSNVLQPSRTSSLPAPTMLLTGHGAAVHANRFNGDGSVLASGSFDKQIYLWRVSADACGENFMALKGHQGSVLDVSWAAGDQRLYSVGSDKVITIWDAQVGYQIKKLRNHRSYVNTCTASRSDPNLFATGSDDCSVLFWDRRAKDPQAQLDLGLPVTAVALANDDLTVFVGGVDSAVTGWDLRNAARTHVLDGAQDMATGVSLSPDGAHLLVNSMDNTVRLFDVRPYCPGPRLVKQFFGATHDFEKNLLRCAWSSDGTKVAAGSADRLVHIWDVGSGRILYKLPGHKGSVNDVAFHPTEPIVASASSDETIYLGELN